MSSSTSVLETKDGNLHNQDALANHKSILDDLVCKASFASVAPKLLKGLQGLSCADNDVIHSLISNIHSLQDAFVDEFYRLMHSHDLDISQKIVLRLNSDYCLYLAVEHPLHKEISRILQKELYLSAMFAEIASQSAAIRHIQNLCQMLGMSKPVPTCSGRELPPAETTYQASLKGHMNHFYFVQTQ